CVKELKKKRSKGLRPDIFAFSQRIPDITPKYTYPMETDSVAVAQFASFDDWWNRLPQETRKNVRRASKRAVQVDVRPFGEDVVKAIMDVNNDCPMLQRLPNIHYGKSIEQLRKDYASFDERSDFIWAYCGEEAIGFLKLVYRGNIASVLNLTTKPSHYDKRPANALIAKAVELCVAKGISYLTYGMFNYGNKRASPLREFKSRNGFVEMLVPRFYVPLTTWGRVCVKLKLHRGLHGILPHGVITVGVNVRAKWYDFQQWLSRRSSMSERPNRNRQMGRSNPPAGSNV